MRSGVQITRFGVPSHGHLGDQVADHIGGSVRLALGEGWLRSMV